MKRSGSKFFYVILAAIIIAAIVATYLTCSDFSTSVSDSYFVNAIHDIAGDAGYEGKVYELSGLEKYKDSTTVPKSAIKVNSLVIDGYNISFKISVAESSNSTIIKSYKTTFGRSAPEISDITDVCTRAGIVYTFEDPNSGAIWSSILPFVGCILVAIVFYIILRQTQGGTKGAMSFAKTQARVQRDVRVRFSDVAGAEEEKEELKEVVEFLKAPARFSALGARIPKGVLLVGPPGTGKTLFAKAVAGEAGVPFFSISGSDFVEMFVGVGASRVRDLFDTAKKSLPCIVFIDEIDAVGRQRGTGLGGGHDEREQTLNQLLVQMDGFETNEGIIVMAATNRADILDPALLRPGRFDRQIFVNLPDVRGREAILRVHSRNKPLAADVKLKTVARMTSGFSGADLENLLNEAAILAARDGRKNITNKDLYEGVNKVLVGPQKKSRLVTETDKRITAYHESGHAILARSLKNCDPVHEVSIIPRGQAAGYTMTLPDNDDNHLTLSKLLDDITMTLGGRVAEEMIIKDISAGASGDIQAVTKRARLMVTEWGMSEKVGPISYGSDKEVFIGRDMASHVNYSDETAATIDQEIKRIVEESLARARKILSEHKPQLEVMARLLVDRETIYSEEVDMIMEGKSVEEIEEFMDKNEAALSENPFERRASKGKAAEKTESEKNADGESFDKKDANGETPKKRRTTKKTDKNDTSAQ